MKWISVEDELPKDEQEVLVTNGQTVRCTYFSIWDSGPSWGVNRFQNPPTHWMPLPEPPDDS